MTTFEVRVVLTRTVEAKDALEAVNSITQPLRDAFGENEVGISEAGATKVDAARQEALERYEKEVEHRRLVDQTWQETLLERDFVTDYEKYCGDPDIDENSKRKAAIFLLRDVENIIKLRAEGKLTEHEVPEERMASLQDLKWRIGREVFGLTDAEVRKYE